MDFELRLSHSSKIRGILTHRALRKFVDSKRAKGNQNSQVTQFLLLARYYARRRPALKSLRHLPVDNWTKQKQSQIGWQYVWRKQEFENANNSIKEQIQNHQQLEIHNEHETIFFVLFLAVNIFKFVQLKPMKKILLSTFLV